VVDMNCQLTLVMDCITLVALVLNLGLTLATRSK
jgi:hypothetical protein